MVRLSADLGLPEVHDYNAKLKRAQRLKEVRLQRQITASGRRNNTAGFANTQADKDNLNGIQIYF